MYYSKNRSYHGDLMNNLISPVIIKELKQISERWLSIEVTFHSFIMFGFSNFVGIL